VATTKLRLICNALTDLGERRVEDTGEAIEAAIALNAVYDQVVLECLSMGSWNFATETIKAESDTGVTPTFGFTEVFAKPSDWLRTVGMSEDEYFSMPLINYYDDATYWSADNPTVYIRYVSSDTGMGLDLNRWTPKFARYVELELAERVSYRLTQNASLEEKLGKKRDKARTTALNHDAMNESQPKFAPPGRWTMARGGRIGRGDRGSRSNLTG
jgi:hypothetical protein